MARINTRSPSWGYDDPRPEPHSMLTCRICGNTPGRSIAQPCPPTISWLFSSVLLRTSIYYRAGSSPAISWPIKFEPRGVLILKPYVFVMRLSRDILPVSISLSLTKMERQLTVLTHHGSILLKPHSIYVQIVSLIEKKGRCLDANCKI